MQVLFRELLTVGRGIDGVLQNEFVARHVFGGRILDLLQFCQHLGLGGRDFLHADCKIRFANQSVIGHGIDGFDDVRIVFQRVVNHHGAAGLFLAHELLQDRDTLARKGEVQLQPCVGLLDLPDLVDLVGGQKVAFLREGSRREDKNHCQPSHCHSLYCFLGPMMSEIN